ESPPHERPEEIRARGRGADLEAEAAANDEDRAVGTLRRHESPPRVGRPGQRSEDGPAAVHDGDGVVADAGREEVGSVEPKVVGAEPDPSRRSWGSGLNRSPHRALFRTSGAGLRP